MIRPDELDEERLGAYLDGELSSAESAEVERGLENHPEYRHALEELRSLRAGMQGLPRLQLGDGFSERVLAAIAQHRKVEPVALNGNSAYATTGPVSPRRAMRQYVFGLVTIAALVLIAIFVRPPDNRPQQPANQPLAGVGQPTGNEPSDRQRAGPAEVENPHQGGVSRTQVPGTAVAEHPDTAGHQTSRTNPLANSDARSEKPPLEASPSVLLVEDERPPEPSRSVAARRPQQPDDPMRLDGWLFLVYEIAITPDGAQNDAFGRAMSISGIQLLQEEFRLGKDQTERLLSNGYVSGIEPVAPGDRNKHVAKDEVVIIYAVATAKQIDRSYEVLQSMRSEVAAMKTHIVGADPALLEEHHRFLKSLHERLNPGGMIGQARRLLSDTLWLTQSTRSFQPISYLPFDNRPAVEPRQNPVLPPPGAPAGAQLGEQMPSEVLYVIHYLNQDLRSQEQESP